MKPETMVIWFIENLTALRRELLDNFGAPGLADIVTGVQSRRIPRRGNFGEIEYFVHGVGCRIERADGTNIDVDIAQDGATEIFSPWKIRLCYQHSNDVEVPRDAEGILASCRTRVHSGELAEPSPGWFSIRSDE